MPNNELIVLLKTVVQHWDRSMKVYKEYMENGKKFKYAQVLMVHNTAVKNLLTENITLLPADLKKEAEAIVWHYTIWTDRWNELKATLNPGPEDEFVFENEHRFPKSASQKLEAALRDLSAGM